MLPHTIRIDALLPVAPGTVLASVAARVACTAKLAYREKAMTRERRQDAESSVNSARLAAVLDKLVTVQLDLTPLCGTTADTARAAATPEGIAEACEILQSAIADLRNIIHQADGLLRD